MGLGEEVGQYGEGVGQGKIRAVIDGDGSLPIQQGRRADGRCHTTAGAGLARVLLELVADL